MAELRKELRHFGDNLPKPAMTGEQLRRAYPFHVAFLTEEGMMGAHLERKIVTRMGLSLYPKIARILAEARWDDVQLNHKIEGNADVSRVRVADRIVDALRHKRQKPNFNEEMNQINSAEGGRSLHLDVTADLYIGDHQDGPVLIELKGPGPNLDMAAEIKKTLRNCSLLSHALRDGLGWT